jgi:ParB-like nuclease domain
VKNCLLSELMVTYEPVSALKPFSRNARTHSERQIRKIAESIKAFGFTNPVLIDQANTIVAGHGRVAAAKVLGIDQVPTIRLEALSPDQVRTYVLADNRLAEKAGWDKATLAIELEHLITISSDLDITVTGFEMHQINFIIQEAKDRKEGNPIRVPRQHSTISKSGDIWLLGTHRIICGDVKDGRSYGAVDSMIRHWQKCTRERAIHVLTGKPFNEVATSSEVSND